MRTFAKYLAPLMFAAATITLAHAEDVAIVGGTVHTMEDGVVIENGVVIISGDQIEAVGGPDTAVPEGYRVIDATGKQVTPGLMSAFTLIGLEEVSLEGATVDHSLSNTFYTAGFEVAKGFNPDTPIIAINRIEGLTRAVIMPGFGVPFNENNNKSIFPGQAGIIHLGGGNDAVINSQAAVVVYPGVGDVGGARGAVLDYLVGALRESKPAAKRRRGSSASGGPGRFAKSPEDKAALAKVVSGEMPLYVLENKASKILQLLELKEEFEDMNLIILGAAEAWIVADELVEAGVPVVIGPTNNLPSSFDSLAATLYNAARLEDAGVEFAIVAGGFSAAHNARLLPQDAGNAVANGLSWQAGLEAITINPAKIFGIDASFGSLTAGKEADVVVWDGDPLEVMTSPDHVFIRGEEIELVSRQTRLRDRYIDLGAEADKPLAYKK